MRKKVLSITVSLLVAGTAQATDWFGPQNTATINATGGSLYTTYDTEHNYKSVAAISAWNLSGDQRINRERVNFGVAITDTLYVNPQNRYYAQGGLFLVDINKDGFFAGGGLGIGTINNKQYFYGDSWAGYNINNYLSVDAGLNGDLVDSVAGLQNNVTRVGGSVGADVHTATGSTGLAFGTTQATYSMGNYQKGSYAKAYTEVYEGISVYVRTKSYDNSMPYNGYFYSPDHYARYLAGVQFKRVVADDYLVSGWVDAGSSVADGVWSPAHTAKFSVDKIVPQGWTYGVTLGTDINTASNYQYFYSDVHARYYF